MKPYKIVIKPKAFTDIQEGISWYNSCRKGLGIRFLNAIQEDFKVLRINPYFQVRYDEVRCLPVKTFPFMIHFIIEEDKHHIVVLGVISTFKNPDEWGKYKQKTIRKKK